MSYTKIFNRPYFAVPPEAPQVQLLLDRLPQVGASAWYADEADGTTLFSIAVYFGSLILHPDDATPREDALRTALGFDPGTTLRLDFACTAEATYLLRAGIPGHAPAPFTAFATDALAAAETAVAAFLDTSLRTILLHRSLQDSEARFLFPDEEVIYEGFLGDEGLPLSLQRLADSSFAFNNTILATIL